tara:strand:- start:3314 stop:3472 length:159 start_codon:yes stop_codon:yes gene_type:complete
MVLGGLDWFYGGINVAVLFFTSVFIAGDNEINIDNINGYYDPYDGYITEDED